MYHSSSDIANNNNNLDLKSIRGNSKDSNQDSGRILDIDHEERNNPCLFSDLSKDYNDSQNQILSNTLDVCSLAKLRRIFGSERLIKEYRTSEESSQYQNTLNQDDLRLNSGDYQIRPEVLKEDLMLHNYEAELYPEFDEDQHRIGLMHKLHDEETKEIKVDEFMGTNEILDLFTSEHAKKTIESGDLVHDEKSQTMTLFDKNPFKDFTYTKIQEVLKDKDFDEMQDIRKNAIDFRASVENKLLNKIQSKESPHNLRSRRIEIEKWVDKELKEINDDTDEEKVRLKTINTICSINIHTERIFNFIQKLNASESS